MKFWKVLVILLCIILLLTGLIVAGIGVGVYLWRAPSRPAESVTAAIMVDGRIFISEDNLYDAFGEYDSCTKDADSTANIDMTDGSLSVSYYLGETAEYDPVNRRLLIEFGVTEVDGLNSDSVRFFLVSDCTASGEPVISPMLKAGQCFTSFPCEALNGDEKATFYVVAYLNGTGTAATASGGIFGIFNRGEEKSDAMFITIGEKNISFTHVSGTVTPDPEENGGIVDRADLAEIIVGSWVTAYRGESTIYTTYYEFSADGTYYAGGCEYMHASQAPELFGEDAEGWQVVPMGYPYEHGTYSVGDGYIEIVCLGDDFDTYAEPFVARLEISDYNGSTAVFVTTHTDFVSEPRRFAKNFDYERVEELCEVLGVDTAP